MCLNIRKNVETLVEPGVAFMPTLGREARHAHTGMSLIACWRPTNHARREPCRSARTRQPYCRPQLLRPIPWRQNVSGKCVLRALIKARPTCTAHAHHSRTCEWFSNNLSPNGPSQVVFARCRRFLLCFKYLRGFGDIEAVSPCPVR